MRFFNNSSELAKQRYWQFADLVLRVALVIHLIFIPLFYFLEVHLLAMFNIFSVLLFAGSMYLIRHKHYELAGWLAHLEVIAHAALACWQIGFDSGFHYYVPLLGVLAFLDMKDSRVNKLIKVITVAIAYLLIAWFFMGAQPVVTLPELTVQLLHYSNMLALILIIGFLTHCYSKILKVSEEHLYSLATVDSLTGAYNRRHMISIAEYEFSDQDRGKGETALIIIDIDHFKMVNDSYGHNFGDQVLKKIANVIGDSIRHRDTLGRWGGEEFLVLLPETSMSEAEKVAQRILQAVEAFEVQCSDITHAVTLSAGVALREYQESLEQLIARADKALYQAKSRGRNRWVCAPLNQDTTA